MTSTARRPRATQAALQRSLRAANAAGLTAHSVKHHPDGVVELIFTNTTSTEHGTPNDWD